MRLQIDSPSPASRRGALHDCAAVAANGSTVERALPRAVMPSCAPQKWLAGQKALVTGASSGIGRAMRGCCGAACTS